MSTLGERIKMLRGESSQQEFADKLSITRQYVALLESDKRGPSPLLMDSLCQKFQVRREWLEFGDEPMYLKDLASSDEDLDIVLRAMTGKSESKKQLLRIIADMPDELLDAFLTYLQKKDPQA